MSINTRTSFRIFLKAYNSKVLTICCHLLQKEIERLDQNYGLKTIIKGPIRLPVKKRYYSLLRSPHIDKDSQEQFEIRKHKWIFDIEVPQKIYINLLALLEFPAGVEISIFFEKD